MTLWALAVLGVDERVCVTHGRVSDAVEGREGGVRESSEGDGWGLALKEQLLRYGAWHAGFA